MIKAAWDSGCSRHGSRYKKIGCHDSHRFVEKYGLLSMHTNEIALPNIEGVRMSQSVLGRLFNYGTVRVEGTGVDSVTTPPIADPVGFVRAIQTAKELMVRR